MRYRAIIEFDVSEVRPACDGVPAKESEQSTESLENFLENALSGTKTFSQLQPSHYNTAVNVDVSVKQVRDL